MDLFHTPVLSMTFVYKYGFVYQKIWLRIYIVSQGQSVIAHFEISPYQIKLLSETQRQEN